MGKFFNSHRDSGHGDPAGRLRVNRPDNDAAAQYGFRISQAQAAVAAWPALRLAACG